MLMLKNQNCLEDHPLAPLSEKINRIKMPAVNHAITICFLCSMCESLVKSHCLYNKFMISWDDTYGILLEGERTQVVCRTQVATCHT